MERKERNINDIKDFEDSSVMSDDALISRSLKYDGLDHSWLSRKVIQYDNPVVRENVSELAGNSFSYMLRNKDTINKNPSLSAIIQMCSCPYLLHDVKRTDPEVTYLSKMFNKSVNSTRELHECYDCGTNARAIFLKLIELHRKRLYICPLEQIRMEKDYALQSGDKVIDHIKKCFAHMRKARKNTIYIMSLGIQNFGHVWIIEKQTRNRYQHYQSSLTSHMVIDFLTREGYGESPFKSIDIDDFERKLLVILGHTETWNYDTYKTFITLFRFFPLSWVLNPDPSFSWTYIEA